MPRALEQDTCFIVSKYTMKVSKKEKIKVYLLPEAMGKQNCKHFA